MCGLYGIMGIGISDIDIKVLRELAQCSVVRGSDGSGMLQGGVYKTHDNMVVEKVENEISYLLWYHQRSHQGNRRLFDHVADNVYAGHVRAATKGTLTYNNTHPFVFKNIIGMHNGTLKDVDYYPVGDQTDSEMMFSDMNTKGIIPTLAKLSPDSAYAVVVYDRTNRTFTFARNKHRPLAVTWNEKRRVFYWASESGMLSWILRRNEINSDKIFLLNEDYAYTFSPLDIQSGKKPSWRLRQIKALEIPEAIGTYPPKEEPKEEQKQDNTPAPLPEQQKAKEKREKNSKASSKETTDGEENFPSKVITFPRKHLHTNCEACGIDMDLYDQHQGTEVARGVYVCKKCARELEDVKTLNMLV